MAVASRPARSGRRGEVSLGRREGLALEAHNQNPDHAGAKAPRQELQVDLQNKKTRCMSVREHVKDEVRLLHCAMDRAMNPC